MAAPSLAIRHAVGSYPEQNRDLPAAAVRWADMSLGRVQDWRRRSGFPALLRRMAREEAQWRSAADGELRLAVLRLRQSLRREGLRPAHVARAFTLVREAAGRRLGMRHHDCQLQGGWVMLWGQVAEMATGEGKTLTATLPVATLAMAGLPVHVVTVNDYLTARDAAQMTPLYEALGLTVGVVTAGMSPADKRRAYGADITYCTNKELAFDYLRDRLTLGGRGGGLGLEVERLYGPAARRQRLLLRGLGFALVDEADSILIDEARTPLIISGGGGNNDEERVLQQALDMARQLTPETHFRVETGQRRLRLNDAGRRRAAQLAEPLGGVWCGSRRREELLTQALSALHLYHRDEHYLVAEQRIVIIDEYTGRPMPERAWSRGLHQLVECKEGCPLSLQRETLAQISYQRFFRRYLHLAGMSGTVREVARELAMVYGLGVAAVPTHRPVRRKDCGVRIHGSQVEKWKAVAQRVVQLHEAGQPVLIGTRTVAAAEAAAQALREIGLPHQLLSARQNEDEAAVVARAGQAGQITIATNMAGRGTDIPLDEAARRAGGLHVMLTERHSARRIDRQLLGRCARQGDPGSVEAILSLEDALALQDSNGMMGRLLARPRLLGGPPGQWLAQRLIVHAQQRLERRHYRMRQALLKADREMVNMLAFSGREE